MIWRHLFDNVRRTAHPAAGEAAIDYHEWTGPGPFVPAGVRSFEGRTYDRSQWTSPFHAPRFAATELIASWSAHTPAGTWIEVEAQARTATGEDTAWYVMGRWAAGDDDIKRTSVDGQDDAHARVSVDTLVLKPGVLLRSYRLRVSSYRAEGAPAAPAISAVGAMTSRVPDRFEVPVSPPGKASGIELAVPAYAQNLHKGHFPEYGGSGESWCSPASTEMVVEYWGHRPRAADMTWIPAGQVDRTVDHAARQTYDFAYGGTGNWPFNTAYAATFGLRGHVTRLHSLTELEDYIARGIPVVTSQSFRADELDGAGYGSAGHIMVVVGFTGDGDVIANDPAANSDAGVRRIYPRAQFENIWQRTKRHTDDGSVASGPGGIVYLITPAGLGEGGRRGQLR